MRVNLKYENYTFVCFKIKGMKSEKTEIQLEIINKLKDLRNVNNLSQAQICEIIDLNSVGQIGNIESPKYKHKYTLPQIYQLANYFNYSIEKIFFTENELENPTSVVINTLILKLIEYEK